MPFLAECILCHQKLRVPDRAAGASVQCPRCKSYFTAAPDDNLVPTARRADAGAAVTAAPAARAPAVPPSAAGAAPDSETPVPTPTPSAPAIFAGPTPATGPRRPVDAVGFLALLLSGLAPPCACVAALTVLVIPLAALGLLVGLGRLAVTALSPRPRFVLAAAGAVLGGAVLFVAVLFPALLGPTYAVARARAEPEVAVPRPVPLPGQKTTPSEASAEWLDAGKFSLQVRKVRVQVAAATVRPLETVVKGKKKLTKENYLVLRVRTLRPAGAAEFAADTWGAAGGGPQRPLPTLTDAAGKVFARAPAELGEAFAQAQQSALFPVGVTDDVFLFEAPPPGTALLRLEMPAAAWGGEGTLRFALPAAMLQTEPAAPLDRGK